MPNQQKYRPISFRPPEADRLWLVEHAKATGQAVNRILVAALHEYRLRHERALARSHMRPSVVAAEEEQPRQAGRKCTHPRVRVKGVCPACDAGWVVKS